ncbi:type II secretion system F family protein [Methanobrevibacter wolinii]|uniref:type II secretion system F family protein n=1 Tax=Methanobrevibacter wolinii TaxID=190977 RepID=UPI000693E673|nr:type II secretion system F family protein [Methanobrevibacter wolinii]
MKFINLLSKISKIYNEKIPWKYILRFQNFLLKAGINIYSCDVLAIFTLISVFLFIILFIFFYLFNIDFLIILILFLSPFIIFYTYLNYKIELRRKEIEESAPDFLKQLGSMLRVGLSFENSMEYMSNYGSGPLYNEIKRTVYEIKLGANFDDAWMKLAIRLNSKNLERSFKIILDGRKSGGSIASVLDDLSYDLRSMDILYKERKSSVMMAIMFLIISAVIATPFAMGMICIYSNFMDSLGKASSILSVVPMVSSSYIIIHSFLVGFIISLIIYGDIKKGFYYSFFLVIFAYLIFYLISHLAIGLFTI